jgi:pSer/pThr/pTyr-binding forkhead associated (FHA) protein
VLAGAVSVAILLLMLALLAWPRAHARPRRAALEFAGRRFALDSEITTVGSQEGNRIVVSDPAVAKKHFAIRRDPNDPSMYELCDLGSRSGVFVNGQRLGKRRLSSGDIIRLGAAEMVFRIEKVG